jgi:MFS family permease
MKPEPPALPQTGMYRLMAALVLVEVMGALEQSMVVAVIPAVARQFNDVAMAGWLITAFGLSAAGTAAIAGRMGDLFGRRRLLIIICVATAIGSLISAVAPSFGWIIAGRTIQGLSGAILPLSYGIVQDRAPRDRAPFWIGVLTGGYSFSAIFGYILGGAFADQGHWSWLFIVTACLSVVAIVPLLAFVPATPGKREGKKIDILGAVLFAPAIALVLFGVTKGQLWGWSSAPTWAVICSGFALLAFWAWYEARLDDPLINVRLLARRNVLVGNLCIVLTSIGMMNLPLVFLLLMQQDPSIAGIGLGLTATIAGLLKLPSNLCAIVATPLAGWMAGRYSARWPAAIGGVIGFVSWTGLMLAHDSIWQVLLWSICCAFSTNILIAALPIMVLEDSPQDRSSEAAGFSMTVRALSLAIGGQIVAVLLASSTVIAPKTLAHVPTLQGYTRVFLFMIVTSLLSALIALFARRRIPAAGTSAAV